MEWLWLFYWGFIILSIVLGIVVSIKKNRGTGLAQVLLSIIVPIWAFVFALKRDYLSTGLESNELYFMYTKIISGDIEAISILLLFIVLIIAFLYNLTLFKTHKR